MSSERAIDLCASCGEAVYLNLSERRSVDVWVHRDTGGRFCDQSERTVASPGSRAA